MFYFEDEEKYKIYKIPKTNPDSKFFMWLRNGMTEEEVRDELRQGVHRPERIDTNNLNIFGGIGYLKYFVGDPFDMFYTPNADKYPYLLDKDMMFYRAIRRKAYYLTLTKEKENIHDAYDDSRTNDWGAESIYYIPCLKSFDNLDEVDELFINYIVAIKQGYFPDRYWDEETYFYEADGLYRILKRNEDGWWDKVTAKYPILLKPEYDLKALNKSINFAYNHHEPIVWETYVKFKKYDKRADKSILKDFPDE